MNGRPAIGARIIRAFIPEDVEVEYLELAELARQTKVDLFATLAFGAILFGIFASGRFADLVGDGAGAWTWFGLVLVWAPMLWLNGHAFQKDRQARQRIAYWRLRFVIQNFINGLVWLALAWLTLDANLSGNLALLALVYLGLISVYAVHVSPHLLAFLVAAVTVAVGFEATMLMVDSTFADLLLVVAPCYCFYAYELGHSSNKRYRQSLERAVALSKLSSDLIVARNTALQESKAKTTFFAMMSHDLRTPLNAIIGFAEILKTEVFGKIGNDRYREYAGDIHDSGNHLLQLVNDLLDISKIESGSFELNVRDFALDDEIRGTVKFLREQAIRKSLEIRIPDRGSTWIKADPFRIRQVLLNLGSNAVKFTPAGGSILFDWHVLPDGGLDFSVSDTGIGIKADDLENVFDPFKQASPTVSGSPEGTGLGLAICKRLMELHGGTLSIASTPGVGTTVTAHLPPEAVLPAEPRRAEAS
ncbi:MAG: ATP-binding protein [Pseudomonadota bacterium]|nr:ATP-binding protein [Pseudomonadota bacterium]